MYATVARARSGDEQARQSLQQSAAHGEGAGEYAVGLGLAEGWDGPPNLAQALSWWRRSAERGNADALNALGVVAAEGQDGRPPDLDAARSYWQRAAAQGHATAQYNLASLIVSKADSQADMSEAADLLHQAASQGDPDAQYFLANLYYNGEGVPRQPYEATRLWRQAAQHGHAEAQLSLAENALAGLAGPVDIDEATRWLQMAAAQGRTDAAELLAQLKRGKMPETTIAQRRAGGLPQQLADSNEIDEPATPVFKKPVSGKSSGRRGTGIASTSASQKKTQANAKALVTKRAPARASVSRKSRPTTSETAARYSPPAAKPAQKKASELVAAGPAKPRPTISTRAR